MNKIHYLQQQIDKQIASSLGRNLFCTKPFPDFIANTQHAFAYFTSLTKSEKEHLISYATDASLAAFYKTNQYYYFSTQDISDLKRIYASLMRTLHDTNAAQQHFMHLKQWLKASNSFSEHIFGKEVEFIGDVACSQYASQLQLDILGIDWSQLAEPILDIGCGASAHLVKYLRLKGKAAFGVDRLSSISTFCKKADWITYPFEADKWGTIISHMGFTNHFRHHHFRIQGQYVLYAEKYMEILYALRHGGSFYYAPHLPFIEQYLNRKDYRISNTPVENTAYQTTCIYRL